MLTGKRLFSADGPALVERKVLEASIPPPSESVATLPEKLDRIVLRALARDPKDRFESARALAAALDEAVPSASALEIGAWVESLGGSALAARAAQIAQLESVPIDELTLPLPASPSRPSRSRPTNPTPEEPVTGVEPGLARRNHRRRLLVGSVRGIGLVVLIASTRSKPLAEERPKASAAASAAMSSPSAPPRLASNAADTPPLPPAPPQSARAAPVETARLDRGEEPGRASAPKRPGPDRPASQPMTAPEPPSERPLGSVVAPDPSRCTPPYVVDERGIKRFILECVESRPTQ
jgi:serine/threonine-protein kinase